MRTLSPRPTFDTMQSEINRFFDGLFNRWGESPSGETLSDWAPRVDIVEDSDSLHIHADLPGMTKEDIKIGVESYTLTVSGERRAPQDEDAKETWHRGERTYGTFKRVFTLPTTVDPEKVSAEYRNGVLTMTLPKVEQAKPRMIDVKVSE